MQRAHGHTDPEKNQVRGWAEGRLTSTQRTVTGKPGRLGPVLALALTTWVTVSTVLPLGVFVCLFRSLHREIRASDETARSGAHYAAQPCRLIRGPALTAGPRHSARVPVNSLPALGSRGSGRVRGVGVAKGEADLCGPGGLVSQGQSGGRNSMCEAAAQG